MKALMLGACLAATFGAPSLAQPGDQGAYQPDPYYDQPPPLQAAPAPQPPQPAPQPPRPPPAAAPPARSYQNDRSYEQQAPAYAPDERGYDEGPAYRAYGLRPAWRVGPYGQAPPWAHYTGWNGQAWRSPSGKVCAWRQLTWQDQAGDQVYQWVPRCRAY